MVTKVIIYDGMLVRTDLEDHGEIPRQGTLSNTPDVIPSGNHVVSNPQGYFSGNYDEYVNQDINYEGRNYIYIRAKNLFPPDPPGSPLNGTVYLYYAKTSQLNHPEDWKNNILKDKNGNPTQEITAYKMDDIVVSLVPYVWYAPAQPTDGDTYNLIGVVGTENNPNPIPDLTGTIDFENLVANNGGIGWLNLPLPKPPVPTWSTTAQFDIEKPQGEFLFQIRAEGIPAGATFSFVAEKPNLAGGTIQLPKTTISRDPFNAALTEILPENWSSGITFELDLQGLQLSSTNKVSMSILKEESSGGSGPAKYVTLASYSTSIYFSTS